MTQTVQNNQQKRERGKCRSAKCPLRAAVLCWRQSKAGSCRDSSIVHHVTRRGWSLSDVCVPPSLSVVGRIAATRPAPIGRLNDVTVPATNQRVRRQQVSARQATAQYALMCHFLPLHAFLVQVDRLHYHYNVRALGTSTMNEIFI